MGGLRSKRSAANPTLLFDSTPFIYLAKAKLANKLSKISFRLITTQAVYHEVVVKGIEKQVKEADELRSLFDSSTIEIVEHVNVEIVERLGKSGIHYGEATIIALAHELDAIAIDDKRARHVAKTFGIKLSSTPHSIVRLVKQELITKQKARKALDKMVEEGWHCSAKQYSKIIELIDKA
ncbi:MAG: hypothetical protein ACUVTD_00110 [Nitrososphaerales archaeon]